MKESNMIDSLQILEFNTYLQELSLFTIKFWKNQEKKY